MYNKTEDTVLEVNLETQYNLETTHPVKTVEHAFYPVTESFYICFSKSLLSGSAFSRNNPLTDRKTILSLFCI